MSMQRFEKNPIMTMGDVPFRVNSIFNAGAVKINGQYLLICRVEMPAGRSAFVRAVSTDGIHFKVDSKLCLTPEQHKEWSAYVQWGIEDARITALEGSFYILYTGYSSHMPLVMLAQTDDFKQYRILGPITEPSNKDAVLFPEKINGFYWKLDRPTAEDRREIWISRSPSAPPHHPCEPAKAGCCCIMVSAALVPVRFTGWVCYCSIWKNRGK